VRRTKGNTCGGEMDYEERGSADGYRRPCRMPRYDSESEYKDLRGVDTSRSPLL